MNQKQLDELKVLYNSRGILRDVLKAVIADVDHQIDAIEHTCDHTLPDGTSAIEKSCMVGHCTICNYTDLHEGLSICA